MFVALIIASCVTFLTTSALLAWHMNNAMQKNLNPADVFAKASVFMLINATAIIVFIIAIVFRITGDL